MFTPTKPADIKVLNETILNTPQPQATSTVQRKSMLERRFNFEDPNEEKHKQNVSYENELFQKEEDSSLGLLDNMSVLTNISAVDKEQKLNNTSRDTERELARKLLNRCSNLKNSFPTTDMNKENNVNVQNVTGILPVLKFASSNETNIPGLDQECDRTMSKASTTSVTFEPKEITARSSGHSRNMEMLPSLTKSCDGISFSASAAENMAQFNNEEFLSGSQMAEQLSIDEAAWQNYTCSMPVTNTEKYELDLSSFSGIIGQLDLSIASCVGKKVSVGEYFKRKCGNIGVLENDGIARTSFDFNAETPLKRNNLVPLVDSTVMTNATADLKEDTHIFNATTDTGENSILNLSAIAHTLSHVDIETSRRLLDELLMVQKKRKCHIIEDNTKKESHTLPLEEESITATPTINCNKLDEDISLVNLATKLSLNSKAPSEIFDTKQQLSRIQSFISNENLKEVEPFISICKDKILKEDPSDKSAKPSFKQDTDINFLLQNAALSLLPNDKLNVSCCVPSKVDIKGYNEKDCNDRNVQDTQKKEMIEKDISANTIGSSFVKNANKEMQPNLNNDVVITENTEQLCNCIVGMTCEVNIELKNQGDRWITYSLELSEIRGDKQSVTIHIPQDAILIKPNGIQSAKIEVKVIKTCKPIIAVLNIIVSDMVVKSKWFMKHMICFKPEELELDIMCDSDKQELNFQNITENSTKVLPIILYNKNSINVPVKLSILHDGLKMFSINDTFNGSVKLNESHDKLTHLVLKSQEKFTVHIKCERLPSMSIDSSQRQSQCWKSKLAIYIQCNNGNVLFRKEVPLYAQAGTCKIQVVDTDIPIVVSRQQSKLLSIINSGNVATHVSATVVPVEGYPDAVQNFSIGPDDMFLQPGERNSFLIAYKSQTSDTEIIDVERHAKVRLIAGNNVYYYWLTKINVEQKSSVSENENYLRCDTPCNFISTNSPTSPQSVTSSRSGTNDRYSPSSTVSSVAVAGNIIPIRATHSALVWNSVKTGKSEIKEFTIRNTSNNKIKIQIDICDDSKSFKFLGNMQTVNTSMVLVMQRTETKTLAVMFSPYHVGPVAGKITMKHYTPARESSESQQYKRISLYGYGGCGKVKISDTFKDTSGKMWLSLGTLSSGTTALRANIKLQNTGDLCSFAKIKVVPKVISPTMDTGWHVNPKELILDPKEARKVSIEFHPKKDDFAILQRSDVSHVATINVTCGDEPTRWRIRRLCNKIKEMGGFAGNENEAFKNIVHPICKTFPKEQLIPGLTTIRDSVQNLSDLCTGVHQYEIMLTVEACADDTFPILHDTDDESQIYYSLISDNSHINEVDGASFFASQTVDGSEAAFEFQEDNFTIIPSIIVLNPPVCNEATITVLSFFRVAQPFQTSLSDPNHFSVSPAEGMLPSKKRFPLKIRCSQRIERNVQAMLEIYTENNKQDVLIKVNVKR